MHCGKWASFIYVARLTLLKGWCTCGIHVYTYMQENKVYSVMHKNVHIPGNNLSCTCMNALYRTYPCFCQNSLIPKCLACAYLLSTFVVLIHDAKHIHITAM